MSGKRTTEPLAVFIPTEAGVIHEVKILDHDSRLLIAGYLNAVKTIYMAHGEEQEQAAWEYLKGCAGKSVKDTRGRIWKLITERGAIERWISDVIESSWVNQEGPDKYEKYIPYNEPD